MEPRAQKGIGRRYRYLFIDYDRSGNRRVFYRRHGVKIRLRAPEGTAAFDREYNDAASGNHPAVQAAAVRTSLPPKLARKDSRSLEALCEAYQKSAEFREELDEATTQGARKNVLALLCRSTLEDGRVCGQIPYAQIDTATAYQMRDERQAPEAAKPPHQVPAPSLRVGHQAGALQGPLRPRHPQSV
jgi:hypothetical protein